ncbi:hypothetical protein JG536_12335 [Burkholderia ambifaria]|uniref:hypothetical protein n=1 Tax=Burkholderia ambifaria TaxID=152480 RepID=UPI00158BDF73|nr:hypothetical protein [Burkholderia ambifaria]QQJ96401.1 hypothetical protein JG536_12335 [Burkholderia ambifaria]
MANDTSIPDISGLNPANESFEGVRNLRPDVLQKSFTDAGLLRPRASSGNSTTPAAQPASPTQSPGASAASPVPTDKPTPKGN